MRKKKIAILAFTCLLSTITFAQSDEFQIVDSLKNRVSNSLYNGGEIEIFPIETVNANCKKYGIVEVKDSIYEAKLQLINSLSADKIELTNKLKTFNEDVQELVNAKDFLDQFNRDPEPSLMFKWQYLKKAQESLDKTSHKIDLYRSKDDVFSKSGGKTPYSIGNYVLKQQGQINVILTDGSYLKSKIENLTKKIDAENNELTHINKTKKVNMPTGEMVRTILKVGNTNIGKEIKGRFVKEDGYAIMLKDFRHFLANELIVSDTLDNYREINAFRMAKICGGNDYVIKNIETGKMYYTTGNILEKWCMNSKLVDLFTKIDNLKIKRQTIDDKILLSFNGSQCVLTGDLFGPLMGNDPTCIKTMNSSVSKYKEYNKLGFDLATKGLNHIRLYKSRLLKDDGLEAWKKETKECDAILSKMRNLPYASSEEYNLQLSQDEIATHIAIMDFVSYSKSKLGI